MNPASAGEQGIRYCQDCGRKFRPQSKLCLVTTDLEPLVNDAFIINPVLTVSVVCRKCLDNIIQIICAEPEYDHTYYINPQDF